MRSKQLAAHSLSSLRRTSHAGTSSFAFLGSANARSEPGAARKGAKNFCYAKLKMPFRVFAFLLAFGQDLCGFRITRHAKGAGREQTEVIMSNSKLQERAVEAAARFIEHKDFELLETSWTSPEGTTIDLIAID